jgi:hypothetical protein
MRCCGYASQEFGNDNRRDQGLRPLLVQVVEKSLGLRDLFFLAVLLNASNQYH